MYLIAHWYSKEETKSLLRQLHEPSSNMTTDKTAFCVPVRNQVYYNAARYAFGEGTVDVYLLSGLAYLKLFYICCIYMNYVIKFS